MAEVGREGLLHQGVGPAAVGLVGGAVAQGEPLGRGGRQVGGRREVAGHHLVAAHGAVAAAGQQVGVEGGLHVELEPQDGLPGAGGELAGAALHQLQQPDGGLAVAGQDVVVGVDPAGS